VEIKHKKCLATKTTSLAVTDQANYVNIINSASIFYDYTTVVQRISCAESLIIAWNLLTT